ncbi:hypothetical protein DKM44_12880 [Deinococcus irradiatisoli]|uniref:Uncharacterized protein n=1 Tax=Deinococcus irradiatisoli TaxID=2202254 RepID=A0A2Z3JJ54_9DEIO|nr:hypothetical protein [Deinococcus irradiatisoli]AWN24016.1 hypothetical protein DKM44_12880 [Deinococcus irradiatisoli]
MSISIRLDPEQYQQIMRDAQTRTFRCGDCKHLTLYTSNPTWGVCSNLHISGMAIMTSQDAKSLPPLPMPSVHEDFGCNRFEPKTGGEPT